MKSSAPKLSSREKLKRRSKRFSVDMQKKQWCDLWHTHFDWDGEGNSSWVARRRYLTALFTALTRARLELAQWGRPYQLFAAVYPLSSGDDAIYVHTPNPNGTEFPLVHAEAQRLESAPRLLMGKIPRSGYTVYALRTVSNPCFVVVPNET